MNRVALLEIFRLRGERIFRLEKRIECLERHIAAHRATTTSGTEEGTPEMRKVKKVEDGRQRAWVVRLRIRFGEDVLPPEYAMVLAPTRQVAIDLWRERVMRLPPSTRAGEYLFDAREVFDRVVGVFELTEPLTDQDWSQEDD